MLNMYFGMHLNVDGSIVYGLRIEAIQDRLSSDVSVDLLARLLVDVHQDSSVIMNDLFSSYQRTLLETVFLGNVENRNKYNVILCETISPLLPAAQYFDHGEYENELKQVLGDIYSALQVTDDDILLLGRAGALVVGPNSFRQEHLVTFYLSVVTRGLFLRLFVIILLFIVSETSF